VKEIRESAAEKSVVQSAREAVGQMKDRIGELDNEDKPLKSMRSRLEIWSGSRIPIRKESLLKRGTFGTILLGNARLKVRLETFRGSRQGNL